MEGDAMSASRHRLVCRVVGNSLALALAGGASGCGGAAHRVDAVTAAPAGRPAVTRRPAADLEGAPRRSWVAPPVTQLGPALEACRRALDAPGHDADVIGRYGLQGRLSDAALRRHFHLLDTLEARRIEVEHFLVRAGIPAATARQRRDACLPTHLAATVALRAHWHAAAATWRLDPALPRPAPLVRAVRRAAGARLLAADLEPIGLQRLAPLELVDVAVIPPGPVRVSGAARGTEVAVVLVYRRVELADRHPNAVCLQRFGQWVQLRGAPSGLRVYPQWRVAACPD
jgi:hypothetical protein